MADYLQTCACNGAKPKAVGNAPFIYRNALLARMMHERFRVRYLVAPALFGKTTLAASYAQLAFSFNDVFWIDGSHPCFLRDLDSGHLESALPTLVPEGGLVVFDDLPGLEAYRTQTLWNACEQLCNRGVEVVACTTSFADPLAPWADRCQRFDAPDFLYDDIDMQSLGDLDIVARALGAPANAIQRIPGLASRAGGSAGKFLSAFAAAAPDERYNGLTFALLALEQGTVDDLARIVGSPVELADIHADGARCFVSIDGFKGEFQAHGMPAHELAQAFSPLMARIAQACGHASANSLTVKVADMLVARGSFERAVSLLTALSDKQTRLRWLADNQDVLANSCHMAAAETLFDSVQGPGPVAADELVAGSLARRAILGVDDDAPADLARCARKSSYKAAVRIQAATVALLAGGHGGAEGSSARHLATSVAEAVDAVPKRDAAALAGLCAFWRSALAPDRLLVEMSASDAARSSPWALACCLKALPAGFGEKDAASLARAIRAHFAPQPAHAAGLGEVLLKRYAIERAAELGLSDEDVERIRESCAAFDNAVVVQRAAYARMRGMHVDGAGGRSNVLVPVAKGPHLPGAGSVPLLTIRLLGRFEVLIGDQLVEAQCFKRQKARTLMALLALDAGRELSRERMGERLWPDADDEKARHNINNTVSLLYRALTLPTGECPYLTRSQRSVRLNDQWLRSDVGDLADICRKLRFDDPEPDLFLYLLEEARDVYRGELLPGEDEEGMVLAARLEMQDRLVGSLMSAARRLSAAGHAQAGLAMAQHALQCDPRREDCYELLMSLQAECGQRPAAIDTWFRYCHYISSELGLGPSKSVSNLYDRIIAD